MLSFITQKYLYDKSDTEMMLKWYSCALEGLGRDLSISPAICPISIEIDIGEVTKLGRGMDVDISCDGTLIDRIDEMAMRYPDDIAIKDDNGVTLTCSQMMGRVHQIAGQLQRISAKPDSYVAMLLEPVADAVCCILAIMRLGIVWVPLDLRNHPDRLAAIVSDCHPYAIVCNQATDSLALRLANGTALILSLDQYEPVSEVKIIENNSERSQPAAILYTSGSTGVPKGVIINHGGLLNQIYGTAVRFNIGREITLQQSPLGFDLMLDQVFLALPNGGTIIIVGREGRGNPVHIAELMVREKVTLTHFVPSKYLALLNYGQEIPKRGSSWRIAFSGGERMGHELRRAFRKLNSEGLDLVNVYGPAEITLACSRGFAPYREEQDVLATVDHLQTSPNYLIEIRDEHMNPVPLGFPGEICISGAGVGLGYLNRPEETQRKFVEADRSSVPAHDRHKWTRLYRSGDLGRLLPDGRLKILGRLDGDSQVKIRGFRVELDEIAKVIMEVSRGMVANAAVSLRQPSDMLVAFIVFEAGFDDDKLGTADWIKANLPLPAYMLPAFIIPIDSIPGTANGKKDRAAISSLPIPMSEEYDTSDNLTTTEQAVREAWREVLTHRTARTSEIDADSDFFQVGGNSILLIKLQSVLQGTFGVRLALPEFFQASTLCDMAHRIASKNENTSANAQLIDWNAEIAALCHGLPQPHHADISVGRQKQGDLVVLLTGATGFLGAHILQRLVEDDRVKEVHCVAIRPDDAGRARHVSVRSSKIIEYQGDLSDLSLGLSEAEAASLADSADLIIHNGAVVSLMKRYQSLRRPNVVSTRVLCELAIPRRIPVHFVSTGALAKFSGMSSLTETSIPHTSPPADSAARYLSGKWANEVLLEKTSLDHGLPTWVHRVTQLVGEGAPLLDVMAMILCYSEVLGAVPDVNTAIGAGPIDLVRVEDVARDIVREALDSVCLLNGQREQPKTRFVHHSGHAKFPPQDLTRYLEGEWGRTLKELPMQEWLDDALENGMSRLVYNFLAIAHNTEHKIVLPDVVKTDRR